MKGRIRAISRHTEGQESNESDPCQGKLQKDLDYAHIPMYAVIWVNVDCMGRPGFTIINQQHPKLTGPFGDRPRSDLKSHPK